MFSGLKYFFSQILMAHFFTSPQGSTKKGKKSTCLESFIEDNIVDFREVGCPSPKAIATRAVRQWRTATAVEGLRARLWGSRKAPRSQRVLDVLRCILSLNWYSNRWFHMNRFVKTIYLFYPVLFSVCRAVCPWRTTIAVKGLGVAQGFTLKYVLWPHIKYFLSACCCTCINKY